jgi:phosphatidylserine decarboxylase
MALSPNLLSSGQATLWGVLVALAFTVPLAWKWQLGVRRVSTFVLAVGAACGFSLAWLDPQLALTARAFILAVCTICLSVLYLAYRFYRDPECTPPTQPGAIVSPAEGLVIYVKRSEGGQIPVSTKHGRRCPLSELLKTSFYSSDVWVVGISMSLLDVHVNRSPIAGKVIFQKHFPGLFGSLRLPERTFDNERATTIVASGDLQIAIVQIASRLVRQIVAYVKVGDDVAFTQRIGAIRLGSQVDVVIPVRDDIEMTVAVGDHVKAGESVLACCARSAGKLSGQHAVTGKHA